MLYAEIDNTEPTILRALQSLQRQRVDLASFTLLCIDGDTVQPCTGDLETPQPSGSSYTISNTGLGLTDCGARGAVITRQYTALSALGAVDVQVTRGALGEWVAVPIDADGVALGAGWDVSQNESGAVSVTSR